MELREPKAKKRVSEPHDLPFPLTFDENTKQIIQYTAHLSTSGTCIVHPEEIKAVYRMVKIIIPLLFSNQQSFIFSNNLIFKWLIIFNNQGYFGKGSLSRSAPCFGKRRFGAPPQVRERQWQRRKTWLEDLKNLEAESFTFTPETSNDPSKSIDDPGKSTDGPSQPASDLFLEVIEDTTGEKINKPIPPQSSPLSSKEPKKKSLNSQDFIPLVDKRTRALSEASSVEILVDSDDQQKPSTSSKPPEDTGLESNDKKTVNIENKTNKNNSKVGDDSMDIDEVILDSSEDDICEVNDKISESGTIEEDNYPLESDSYCDNYDNLMDVNETEENLNEVIVLPDSDDDSQDNQDPEVYVKNYMDNVNPRLESDGFPMTETLQLTFEETFFLMYGLGCLQLVNYDGSFFSILDAWKHFNKQDKHFLPRYIVYHYYRSNGWVVKPGIKYGGDYR